MALGPRETMRELGLNSDGAKELWIDDVSV